MEDHTEITVRERELQRHLSWLSNSLSVIESDDRRLKRELEDANAKIRMLEEQANAPKEGTVERLNNDALFFCAKVDNFLMDVGGYAYLTDRLSELPDDKKKMYISAVRAIAAWSQNILEAIG